MIYNAIYNYNKYDDDDDNNKKNDDNYSNNFTIHFLIFFANANITYKIVLYIT